MFCFSLAGPAGLAGNSVRSLSLNLTTTGSPSVGPRVSRDGDDGDGPNLVDVGGYQPLIGPPLSVPCFNLSASVLHRLAPGFFCFGVQLMNRAERGRLGGNCGFCSNSILLYFPLSVCLCVHRPDICTFLNYWMI